MPFPTSSVLVSTLPSHRSLEASLPHPGAGRALAALAAAAVLALGVAAAPGARAGEPTTREVAVISVSPSAQDNAEILHDVKLAIQSHPRYRIKDLHAVLNAGGEVQDQNNVKTAEAFVKAGRAAAKAGDYEDAAEQFESAAQLMEQSYALLPDARAYQGVLLQLGAARLASGDKAGAEAAFKRAAILRADLSRTDVGQTAAQAYEDAKASVAKLGLGAASITTAPTAAEVYVDGRYKGISPATVAGLRAGPHMVAVFKDGFARQSVQIEVGGDEMADETIELKPARRKLLFDQLKGQLQGELDKLEGTPPRGGEGVRQITALLFSEMAVIVRLSGTAKAKKVELFAFDTGSQILLHKVSGTVDWSYRNKAAIRKLVSQLADFDYAVALGGDSDAGVGAGGGGVTSKWWFWTLIGVGVAGVATGVVLAVLPGEQPPPFPKDGSGAVVISF